MINKSKMPETRESALHRLSLGGAVLAVSILELVGEPVQTLVQPVSRGGARGLDVPVAVPQRVQPQLVRDLRCVHRVGQVLHTHNKQTLAFQTSTWLDHSFTTGRPP